MMMTIHDDDFAHDRLYRSPTLKYQGKKFGLVNLGTLSIEIYKSLNGISTTLISDLFHIKESN